MAYSKEQWDKARTLFEAGLSLSQISEKTTIDKSSISKKAKIQQWKSGEHIDYIEAKQKIVEKKSTLSIEKINTLDEIADEAIRNKNLIFGVTQKALQKAKEMIEDIDSASDLKTIVDLSDRASLTLGVNQRHANSQVNIQNTNAQQTNIDKDLILNTLKTFEDEY